MSLYEDYENGGKAYYDEVPRYKNPYSGSNHYDDSNHAAWEKGWKRASQEHNLFTENQTLKAEKEALEISNAELQGDNDYLREVAIRCKEDKATFVTAFGIASDKLKILEERLERNHCHATNLIKYIKETNKLL